MSDGTDPQHRPWVLPATAAEDGKTSVVARYHQTPVGCRGRGYHYDGCDCREVADAARVADLEAELAEVKAELDDVKQVLDLAPGVTPAQRITAMVERGATVEMGRRRLRDEARRRLDIMDQMAREIRGLLGE